MKSKKIKVFIEAEVLVLDHFSGIGHYTASLLQEVDKLIGTPEFSHISIELGLPYKLANRIKKFGFVNYKYTKIFAPLGFIHRLKMRGLLPPIDLFFGKKTYVFTHFTSWPTLFSPQIPIIYDLSFVRFPQYAAEKNQKFLEKYTSIAAKRATRIITISEHSRSEISEHYDIQKSVIDVVIPILDKNKFTEQSKKVTKHTRAKYSLFNDYILFVGNIEPRKNLVTLLKAYDKLSPELQKKYSLLLVGAKGWKDDEIRQKIDGMRNRGLNIIQPSKYVEDDDLPALYSAATVFAYVSTYEGYGIPPTEAMACATPVISSNNSSLPEAVENAALMVDAQDVKQITKALEQMLSSDKLRKGYVSKGLQRVERLNPELSARAFLNTIDSQIKVEVKIK